MKKHYGQIIEYVVRKLGYSVTELAARLQVNRATIYNYFQNPYLKLDVISDIGLIIRYDFSKDFPELFTSKKSISQLVNKHELELEIDLENNVEWKDKYVEILERYNLLLIKLHDQNQEDAEYV